MYIPHLDPFRSKWIGGKPVLVKLGVKLFKMFFLDNSTPMLKKISSSPFQMDRRGSKSIC
jgi:hypothetical protein